jgi:hypothetical protein
MAKGLAGNGKQNEVAHPQPKELSCIYIKIG